MFCKRCYANLSQTSDARCPRCGRPFDPAKPGTWYTRPFPSRRRILMHTLVMLFLATIVSAIVAGFLATAQLKHINSGH